MRASSRPASNPLGAERVLIPKGVLPQAADRLDPSLPLFRDETLLEVDQLNLDSASFRQLRESCGDQAQLIAERILGIVRERGKMQNPVTGSGGMLVGRVVELGPEAPPRFAVGDRVATLVSLTLTPLVLEGVSHIDMQSAQATVRGRAILFASAPAVRMPDDLPEGLALSILDVCGAPAHLRDMLRGDERLLMIGAGKSAALSVFAALERLPREAIWVSDVSAEALERFGALGAAGHLFQADAQDPLGFATSLRAESAPPFDWVVNLCNAPETEAASILAARQGGQVLFFNMATNFSRAVLSAEGMGREVRLLMGNGYAEGHAEYALSLVRKHPVLEKFF
ncbi:MAG: L-erythro-3,5-diaminohexanoate dehydrogenase [bacterium]